MERRTLIALALSFLVIGFYPFLLRQLYPEHYKNAAVQPPAKAPAAKPAVKDAVFLKASRFAPEDDVTYRSAELQLVLNKKDGGIREIALPAFPDSETKAPIKFLSARSLGASPTAVVVTSGGDTSAVTDYAIAQNGAENIFSATALGGKLAVVKKITFGQGYSSRLTLEFENTSDAPLDFYYELVAGSGIAPRHSIDAQYIEADFFSRRDGKKTLKHINETRAGRRVQSDGPVDWVAVKDRHFSVVLKPAEAGSFSGIEHGLGDHDLSASLLSPELRIPARGQVSAEFTLYIGPNELGPLAAAGLEDLVNFGKFDAIGKLLVGALELLQKVFKNYGVAIIVLTTLINVLLFPLTRVSYMSMKRMQLIQPQMTKLREQYKKSPDKLNKEMMELYRKHKVNPFGGCVPMLMQIPIFIALYVALSKSVILINSKLFWIRDLSSPDSVYLPFSLPFLGHSLHVLPLLMVGAMFFQQKFTQIQMPGQDPMMAQQQKMMAVMMPIVFGFIFYQMPSGLVLYWLTNTVLMSLYQLRLKNMTLA